MTMQNQAPIQILRLEQVCSIISLSRSAVYDRLDPKSPRHDRAFPKQIQLGSRSVGFLESEVQAWLQARVDARQGGFR